MKAKKTISFIVIFCIVLLLTTPVFASSISKKIEVLANNINLFIDNKQISVDNFVYNGTTYAPLRAIAESLDMTVDWNNETKKVNIVSDTTLKLKTTDGKYNILNNTTKSIVYDHYYLWNYLDIVFDKNTKGIKSSNQIYLTDMKGNRIQMKASPGFTKPNNFILSPSSTLSLNTYYTLYIPKDQVIMENGDLYGEEIFFQFKTAYNAIVGEISSKSDLFGKNLTIQNTENTYTTRIKGNNEFILANIIPGSYEVIIDDKVISKILVEDNKINNIKLYLTQTDNNN